MGLRFCLVLAGLGIGVLSGIQALDSPEPVLLLDHQDHPWAAWVEPQGAVTVARVAQWTATGWATVGLPLHHDQAQSVTSVSLALGPDGTPWAAWAERPALVDGASAGWVHVARWTKTAWEEPAPPPSRSGQPGGDRPLIRIDAQGKVWVLWTEVAQGAKVETVGLATLDDQHWTPIDDPALSTGLHLGLRSREMALGPDGNPVVVLSRQVAGHGIQLFVSRWDGQHLVPLGQGLNVNPEAWAGYPSLAIDAQNLPTVAFVEAADHLKLVVKFWSGSQWRLSGTPGSLGLETPKVALTPNGYPVVAAVEKFVGVTVRQRSNAGWVDLGAGISASSQAETPDLAVDSQGNPWVLWAEPGDQVRLGLKHWTGRVWLSWPSPPGSGLESLPVNAPPGP